MPELTPEYYESLVKKFLKGTISAAEMELLNENFNKTPDDRPVWNLRNETHQQLQQRLYSQIRQEITGVKSIYPKWMKYAVAASVLMFATAAVFIFKAKEPLAVQQLTVKNKPGSIRKIILPDHSLVWLKGNSSLAYPAHFSDSTRNVTLHGEALFEVSKNRLHPFIINTGSYIARVLGTSFNIKENSAGAFKLTVLTGKVQITSSVNKNIQKSVVVTPGRQFEMSYPNAQPRLVTATVSHKDDVVLGTQYPMNFEETGFEDIKRKVEEKFDVVINTGSADYSQCKVSANVTDQSLTNTLKVICAAIGADFTVNNNKINITGGGCK